MCPTLCDPIDGSPPGSPIPGILQARTPEWVAIAFSKRRERKMYTLGQIIEDAFIKHAEKEMATHSGVLAWRIPGMGEPGGLPSMGSHRVGHD